MSLEFWAGVIFAVGVGLIGWWVRDRHLLAQRDVAAATRVKSSSSTAESRSRKLPRRWPSRLELGRTLSPRDPVPGNAADRVYGNWACPRFFRRLRAAGTTGGRSASGDDPLVRR